MVRDWRIVPFLQRPVHLHPCPERGYRGHYRDLSDRVYRFSAMDLTNEERSTIYGINERIRLEVIHRAVEFFIRLMRQC